MIDRSSSKNKKPNRSILLTWFIDHFPCLRSLLTIQGKTCPLVGVVMDILGSCHLATFHKSEGTEKIGNNLLQWDIREQELNVELSIALFTLHKLSLIWVKIFV